MTSASLVAMGKTYYVYIMSNESKMLYVGVTNDLHKRVFQHKSKLILGFTQKYNLCKLVYFEMFGDIRAAIAREKQIKGWLRSKKVALITAKNPHWKDLAEHWFENPSKNQDTRPRADFQLKYQLRVSLRSKDN